MQHESINFTLNKVRMFHQDRSRPPWSESRIWGTRDLAWRHDPLGPTLVVRSCATSGPESRVHYQNHVIDAVMKIYSVSVTYPIWEAATFPINHQIRAIFAYTTNRAEISLSSIYYKYLQYMTFWRECNLNEMSGCSLQCMTYTAAKCILKTPPYNTSKTSLQRCYLVLSFRCEDLGWNLLH